MKLAEALILRANQQKRLDELRQRLNRNAKVQEGEQPAENPVELLEEVAQGARDLMRLIQRINATNAGSAFDATRTISDAIAERDILRLHQGILANLVAAAAVTQDRYSRSEVKFKSTVNIGDLQKEVDRLAATHRQLDAQLQAANWQIDLIE